MKLTLEDFLSRNRITPDRFQNSNCDWPTLDAIGDDHDSNVSLLSESAAYYANIIQKLPDVHSVRWRVKNTEHLLEKIVRRRLDNQDKYASLTAENYFETVPDLVGIRALHLFKDDCFEILKGLRSLWTPIETPVAYIREGDPEELTRRYKEQGLEVKIHEKGYRSIHYVCSAKPLNRQVIVEIQIRTIFEEGWSEIDHRIRYPNFSDDQLIGYFLAIFNRLAGSSDEMGSFVSGLATELKKYRDQIARAEFEKSESIQTMQKALNELEEAKQEQKGNSLQIQKLRAELDKFKAQSPFPTPLGSAIAGQTKPLSESDFLRKYYEGIENERQELLSSIKSFGPKFGG